MSDLVLGLIAVAGFILFFAVAWRVSADHGNALDATTEYRGRKPSAQTVEKQLTAFYKQVGGAQGRRGACKER